MSSSPASSPRPPGELPERWQQEFVRFVETGQASDGFLRFLDEDPGCLAAVDEALAGQLGAFQDLYREAVQAEEPVPPHRGLLDQVRRVLSWRPRETEDA